MKGLLDRIATERLTGERLTEAHRGEVHRMHQDLHTMATMGGVRSLEETDACLAANLSHWETHGFGVWILREKETGAVVGRGVLRAQAFDDRPETSVGYALFAEHWGKGYATETARSLVEIGFSTLECTSLVAVTLPHNVPSQRVLAKAGFAYERDVIHAEGPHFLYRRWPRAASTGAIR